MFTDIRRNGGTRGRPRHRDTTDRMDSPSNRGAASAQEHPWRKDTPDIGALPEPGTPPDIGTAPTPGTAPDGEPPPKIGSAPDTGPQEPQPLQRRSGGGGGGVTGARRALHHVLKRKGGKTEEIKEKGKKEIGQIKGKKKTENENKINKTAQTGQPRGAAPFPELCCRPMAAPHPARSAAGQKRSARAAPRGPTKKRGRAHA